MLLFCINDVDITKGGAPSNVQLFTTIYLVCGVSFPMILSVHPSWVEDVWPVSMAASLDSRGVRTLRQVE